MNILALTIAFSTDCFMLPITLRYAPLPISWNFCLFVFIVFSFDRSRSPVGVSYLCACMAPSTGEWKNLPEATTSGKNYFSLSNSLLSITPH